ncbi:MAG: geranylgeranyl diphosphate synthase, type [Actinomycetota bacterium]|jgi:geranylgeranyl diphosphate synthase type I|nr:geranylgeranyl diphosphate synthase, type [Actinomycetota bacterium]
MGTGPLDRDDLRERVDKALSAFLTGQGNRLDAVSPSLASVQEAAADFLLTGGKRMRPAFCYWGYRGAGGESSDAAVTAAACLELLQAGALIHDDVMDGSDTRRGQPAMHRRFAAMHRDQAWQGDADAFGQSAAVLLGDLCLIWADEMLNTCGLRSEALLRAQPVYDEMRVELMAGQYLDLFEQVIGEGSVDSALRVARFKSAKYTIERPLHLGAVLAGAGREVLASYSGYGLPLGEAFQLRDDVLGVFGDPNETGKPAGDDLREGKRTVLVALALRDASPGQADVVRRLLGDPALDEAGVSELRRVIVDTGALDRVEALIRELMADALTALDAAPIAADAKQVLEELAQAATARSV